jgi:hypothetical protein
VGAHDATVAETFAAEAVTAARASLAADDLELVDALAEAGWARWLAGNRAAAYVDWDEAGRHVYDRAAQDGAAAARLVALLGPLTHASIALRRQAGSTSTESSAPIGAPERGTVLRAPHRLSAPLADTVRVALALVLNDVAQGLGRDAAAVEWATAGLPTARGAGDLPTVALLAPSLVPAALEAGQEAPILRDLLTAGRAVAAAGTTSLGRDVSGEAVARAAIRAGDGHGALCGLLPMVLRLAALTVEGSAATPQAGARAAAACRWVAAEGLGTAAGWRAAATLIERGFAPGARAVALTHDADNLGGAAEPFATALRSVAYLAASLDPTLSAVTALRAHLAVLPWLEPELAPFPTLYRATLTRFLTRFWVREADDAGSRFRAPDRVRAALATLAARPPAAFRSVVGDLVVIVSSNLAWAPDALTTRWLGTLPPSA